MLQPQMISRHNFGIYTVITTNSPSVLTSSRTEQRNLILRPLSLIVGVSVDLAGSSRTEFNGQIDCGLSE